MNSGARNFARKVVRVPARVVLPGGTSFRARTVDISLGGVCVTMADQLPLGQLVMVAFEVVVSGQPSRIVAKAKVVYSILSGTDGFRTGLQFEEIDAASNKTLAEMMI